MSQRPAATLVWMREEDDQLRGAAVSGESIAAISKRFFGSKKAICHRARKMGTEWPQLRKSSASSAPRGESQMKLGPRPTGRPWTPADDAQLLALLESKMDRALIARKLQRSVQAITSRKSRLNQSRLVELGPKAKGK